MVHTPQISIRHELAYYIWILLKIIEKDALQFCEISPVMPKSQAICFRYYFVL